MKLSGVGGKGVCFVFVGEYVGILGKFKVILKIGSVGKGVFLGFRARGERSVLLRAASLRLRFF